MNLYYLLLLFVSVCRASPTLYGDTSMPNSDKYSEEAQIQEYYVASPYDTDFYGYLDYASQSR